MKTNIFLLCGFMVVMSCQTTKNTKISGPVFGTSYGITYYSETIKIKRTKLDSLFHIINNSLSTYKEDSYISKINRNQPIKVDDHFITVFNTAREVYDATDGAFDPTIGAVVNAWNFGPKGKITGLDDLKVDSLMLSVGFDKIRLENNVVIKENPATFIDFNAIAKGYGVDVVARYLEALGIENYIVEIGGEIRCKGINIETQNPWRVGVEKPNFDGTQSLIKAIYLHDEAMATSGTYRKFSIDEDGNRYSHIIDTETGYPSKTNLLSISIITDNCMIADAYATAFKSMGIEKVKTFLESHPELKVFLIFENEQKELETLNLNGFPED
ncbi:thiamine biosynthesis lipoprotein [Flavobacteriaceae bacterium MAR_2010_72]|nr:thiamine biosynthesis lipoprotein [Flavobacteriaceae bacterium MAR_2010_72]